MARIKRCKRPEKFVELDRKTGAIGEKNDCAVKAVALALRTDYEDARIGLRLNGRKNSGSASIDQINRTIKMGGVDISRVNLQDFKDQYPAHTTKYVTSHHMRKYNKVWANGKRYIAYTNDHVLYIENGEVIDWSINKSLRIISLYELIDKESENEFSD